MQKKGSSLAFLQKNFQDQMAYDFRLPKESLWNWQVEKRVASRLLAGHTQIWIFFLLGPDCFV